MLEIEAEVVNNIVEFQLEKALPTGTYTVEIEHGGYVFPSSNSETILVNENLGEFVSEKGIELYSLKKIVKKYVEETKEENTSSTNAAKAQENDLKTNFRGWRDGSAEEH